MRKQYSCSINKKDDNKILFIYVEKMQPIANNKIILIEAMISRRKLDDSAKKIKVL